MFRRIAILATLTLFVFEVVAQNDTILVSNKDSVVYRYTPIENITPKSNQRKGREAFMRYLIGSGRDESFERKVDMTFLPTIYYTPSTSVGLLVMASGRYRLDKQNRNIPASDFSVYATASITGFYRVGVNGCNIFKNDNQRIIYNAEFSSMPTSFWGVGYDAAMANTSLQYIASRTLVDLRFLQRAVKGLYVGAGVDFNYHFGRFNRKNCDSEADFTARLNGERVSYLATGISLFVEFDTRDVISSPQRGVYVAVQAKVRPKAMGDVGKTLWMGRLSANYYQRLWQGAILAFDLQGEINSKGTPWVYNATFAPSIRGYYGGRFNDLCAITLQADLRQRIYKGFGAVAWGGAGNIFHDFRSFRWDETLPTYGVGLRYEIRNGVNVRFDYGFGRRDHRGKLIHGAVFSLNEAF